MGEATQDNVVAIEPMEPTRLVINCRLLDSLLWKGITDSVAKYKVTERINNTRNRKFHYQMLVTLSDAFPENGEVTSVDSDTVTIEWEYIKVFNSIKNILRFIDKSLYKLTTEVDYGIKPSEGSYGDDKHE